MAKPLGPQFPPMEETSSYGAPYYPSPNAPTAQGKLFRDPKPTAEHRWPRGYNPERQRQARAVTTNFEGDTETNGNYTPEVEYKQREWANDVIARSSADLSPLYEERQAPSGRPYKTANIKKFEITDDEYDHDEYPEGTDRGGFWNTNKRHLSMNRALVSSHHEQTLMHELGHANSTFTDPTKRYRTNVEMGREEGQADAYMAKHWVPGKSTTESPREHDYNPRDWQGQGDPGAFSKAYADVHAEHGLQTPTARTEGRQAAKESALDARDQRQATHEDTRLFNAYDYGTGKGEYYGRDRNLTAAPKHPEDMADESYGLGYSQMFDKDAYARLPLSEEGNIQTRGTPVKEIMLNRVQAGRLPHDWRSRTRFSQPL